MRGPLARRCCVDRRCQPIDMDFVLLDPVEIGSLLETAGFAIEKIAERQAYPEVEYPSRRAYTPARNAGT